MVPWKPHSVQVAKVTQAQADDLTLENPTSSTEPTSVDGYFSPKPPTEVFQKYGLEILQPAVFFCEASDAPTFPLEAQVSFQNEVWAVKGVKLHAGGTDAEHAEVVLELKQFPL